MPQGEREQRQRRLLAVGWILIALLLARSTRTTTAHESSNAATPTENAPFWFRTRALFVLVAVLLVGCFVGFGAAGYVYRPSDTGPAAKPHGAVQLFDFVVDHPGIDAAVRLSIDSTSEHASYLQIAVGADTPRTTVRWALVLCLDGKVRLETTSTEPTPVTVRSVLPAAAPTTTYLVQGSIGNGSTGYTALRDQITTQSDGDGVYLITLQARGMRAAAYDGPYLTIPVAAGMSDTFRTSGLAAAAPSPQQLLRAVDQDTLGWNPNSLRTLTQYQSNAVPSDWIPDGVLPPQTASTYWYWDTSATPRSSSDYSTARSPSELAREQMHVFWSGVFLALSGSALLALIPLAIAWPPRHDPHAAG